jgi:alanyl-tRNA synthetase
MVNGMEETIRTAKAFFNNVPDLAGAIRKMVEENEAFKKQMEEIAKEKTLALKSELKAMAKEVNGVNIVVIDTPMDPVMLKNAAFMLQKEAQNLIIAAAFEAAGKPQLLLMYTEDLVKAGHNAGADVREAAKLILGGGGGQPGLATAGGKDLNGLKDALAKLTEAATK